MKPANEVTLQLEQAVKTAGARMRQFPKGGPLGLTPDVVKQSAEYRAAKTESDRAFAALRKHNAERARA